MLILDAFNVLQMALLQVRHPLLAAELQLLHLGVHAVAPPLRLVLEEQPVLVHIVL